MRATTATGASYTVVVAAPGDPGYAATAVMLGESALALALGEDLPDRAGVLTPATGLGDALVDRLRAAGFELSVVGVSGGRDRERRLSPARPSTPGHVTSAVQLGQHVAAEDLDPLGLVAPDVVQVDPVEAEVDVLLDLGAVLVGVGAR